MVALKGYVSGNTIVADGAVPSSSDGKEVIITILDSFRQHGGRATRKKVYTAEDTKEAFGMWKDRADTADVEGYVRNVREGRCFDCGNLRAARRAALHGKRQAL